MYLLSIWTFIVAISISIVAAYYSIVGLTAIFAAAVIPVIIMGTVLEVGKITTAVWLHLNWKNANWLIKTYLVTSTLVLMLITSMGIFGFLSRAHIEQQSTTQEQFAKISQIEQQINYNENEIKLKTNEIAELSTNKTGSISEIQSQIDIEQERIDRVLERIKPEIQEQENIINEENIKREKIIIPIRETIADYEKRIQLLQAEREKVQNQDSVGSTIPQQISQITENITSIEQELLLLDTLKDGGITSIRRLQNIIGVEEDGQIGPATARAIDEFILNQTNQKNSLSNQITDLKVQLEQSRKETSSLKANKITELDNNISDLQNDIVELRNEINSILSTPSNIIEAARDRITEIRNTANSQVDNSNLLIQTLRQELKNLDDTDDRTEISTLEMQIKNIRTENLGLTSEKFVIESDIRKLEAEVGPIKYIAELMYEDTDNKETLEKAVRIVILLLVFVFDPLAIVLVIAAISTFGAIRNTKKPETKNKETTDNDISINITTDAINDIEDNSSTDETSDIKTDDVILKEPSVPDDLQEQFEMDLSKPYAPINLSAEMDTKLYVNNIRIKKSGK